MFVLRCRLVVCILLLCVCVFAFARCSYQTVPWPWSDASCQEARPNTHPTHRLRRGTQCRSARALTCHSNQSFFWLALSISAEETGEWRPWWLAYLTRYYCALQSFAEMINISILALLHGVLYFVFCVPRAFVSSCFRVFVFSCLCVLSSGLLVSLSSSSSTRVGFRTALRPFWVQH